MFQNERERNPALDPLRLPLGSSFLNYSHLEKTWERNANLNQNSVLEKNSSKFLQNPDESLIENKELVNSMHKLLKSYKREKNQNTPPTTTITPKPLRDSNIMESSAQNPLKFINSKPNSQLFKNSQTNFPNSTKICSNSCPPTQIPLMKTSIVSKISQINSTSVIPLSVINSPGYLPATRFLYFKKKRCLVLLMVVLQ